MHQPGLPIRHWEHDLGDSDPPMVHYCAEVGFDYLGPPAFFTKFFNMGPSDCVWIIPSQNPTGWPSRS